METTISSPTSAARYTVPSLAVSANEVMWLSMPAKGWFSSLSLQPQNAKTAAARISIFLIVLFLFGHVVIEYAEHFGRNFAQPAAFCLNAGLYLDKVDVFEAGGLARRK